MMRLGLMPIKLFWKVLPMRFNFEKDEKTQYIASFNQVFLHAEAIEKLESLIDAEPVAPSNNQRTI